MPSLGIPAILSTIFSIINVSVALLSVLTSIRLDKGMGAICPENAFPIAFYTLTFVGS